MTRKAGGAAGAARGERSTTPARRTYATDRRGQGRLAARRPLLNHRREARVFQLGVMGVAAVLAVVAALLTRWILGREFR